MAYFENKPENNIYFAWQRSMELHTQYTKIHSVHLNIVVALRLRSVSLQIQDFLFTQFSTEFAKMSSVYQGTECTFFHQTL